ncbi:MAG: SGNH/GDSL hydrolase family protein [Planctomycetota bacterium]|jgi:lysophospholipase L1-like esterase
MQSRIDLKPNNRILFIGDSITDADRRDPAYQPLGNGYVHFAANMLVAKYPQLNLEIINRGINGDTTRAMKQRWQTDCIEHKPDVLSVLIGINDLWTRHAGPEYLPYAVYPEEYELTYRLLLSEAKERCDCKFVLLEPFMFCSDLGNQMLKDLRKYIEVVQRLAGEFDAVLVRLQSLIDAQILKVEDRRWSSDTIHPYEWAHAWIARQWLRAVGL